MRFGKLPVATRLVLAALAAAPLAGCVGEGVAYGPPPPAPVVYVQPARYSLPADVLFAFDSATLRPEASAALAQTLAQIRQAIPTPAIRVEGNTDSIGSDSYNQRLSLQRAEAVARWLEANGIPPRAITTIGNGKSRPIAPNTLPDGRDNPQGRALNRRVDLIATPYR
ncbi:OmpA family protein [Acetobacteraceae bacterium KSS8]|uniref:OmpA family protein n=1 Tax=Endosaccharibacter trunci TaxID=2812733 RepID=A0ABT1W204_9PROT|nr:OmpA family protein [Acetobacteraceae bacterium KSS8]